VTFWEHFLRLLPRKPWPALAALYWHVTRRRVRANNRLRAASADLPFAYALWIARNERSAEIENNCKDLPAQWDSRPRFSILLHSARQYSNAELTLSLKSLEEQVYPEWTLLGMGDDPVAPRIAHADGDYLIALRVGDVLPSIALFRFAEAIRENPEAPILYGDEDKLDQRGERKQPWFKPRWNMEMFLALDFLSSSVAIEAGFARKLVIANEVADIGGLLLAATSAAADRIVHVPHILCHVGAIGHAATGRHQLVARHLRASGATCSEGPFSTVKVQWPLPDELPLVSMIVPTKDKLELLQPCVESVLQKTTYPNFELLIVDNSSIESRTAEYLAEIAKNSRVRVLSDPRPYNFSAINNLAARHARGTYLCLLNNDTEVVEPEWLTEMIRYAVREDVGAVGAKLLYEDGSIQHAGVTVGIGDAAGHAHRFLPNDQPGYFRQAHVAQFVSAVTAACLVVQKRKFLAVDGLDEAELAVAFNDVDLCLKLQAAGWRNVYVPHAILLHHESKSRGKDEAPENFGRYRRELEVLQRRWGTKTCIDPLHNPNLDRYSETYVIQI